MLRIPFECNVNKTLVLFCLFFRYFFSLFFWYESSFATELYGSCRHHLAIGIQKRKSWGTMSYQILTLTFLQMCGCLINTVATMSEIWPVTNLISDTPNLSIFQTYNFLIFVILLFKMAYFSETLILGLINSFQSLTTSAQTE